MGYALYHMRNVRFLVADPPDGVAPSKEQRMAATTASRRDEHIATKSKK